MNMIIILNLFQILYSNRTVQLFYKQHKCLKSSDMTCSYIQARHHQSKRTENVKDMGYSLKIMYTTNILSIDLYFVKDVLRVFNVFNCNKRWNKEILECHFVAQLQHLQAKKDDILKYILKMRYKQGAWNRREIKNDATRPTIHDLQTGCSIHTSPEAILTSLLRPPLKFIL